MEFLVNAAKKTKSLQEWGKIREFPQISQNPLNYSITSLFISPSLIPFYTQLFPTICM